MLAAGRTWNLVFLNELHHLLLAPGIHAALNGDPFFGTEILNDLIRAETLMTLFTVHQRIGKTAQMTGGHPCLRVHQDRAVHTYIVGAFHNKLFPPGLFHIILQLHAKVAVIPGVGKSAVNFRTRIYESSGFGKCYDFFHGLFHRVISSTFIYFCCLCSQAWSAVTYFFSIQGCPPAIVL